MKKNASLILKRIAVAGFAGALAFSAFVTIGSELPRNPVPSVSNAPAEKTQVTKAIYGTTPEGVSVDVYTLKSNQLEVRVITFGGTLISLMAPDRAGKMDDVVLGYKDLAAYLNYQGSKGASFLGSTVGRYANRIARGQFSLDGNTYHLAVNNGPNALHGGPTGFANRIFLAKTVGDGVELSYHSKDGEEGYPGNLDVTVRYLLTGGDLKIEYSATTDKATVLNLTNHAYFNLTGGGNVLATQLKLDASRYTPVDTTQIPTGELRSVAGTPFDFRKTTPIGERINADDEQIRIGHGYDHNFVLDGEASALKHAAEAYDPASGRVLEVLTTEPAVQLYTGNFLDGSIIGKQGKPYLQNYAFCLETQHFPDSPNHPAFPTTVLRPGEKFHSVTIYRLSTRK